MTTHPRARYRHNQPPAAYDPIRDITPAKPSPGNGRARDLSSREGAEEHVADILGHWLELGFTDVEATVVAIGPETMRKGARAVYGVKTNLIGGLPPSFYEKAKKR